MKTQMIFRRTMMIAMLITLFSYNGFTQETKTPSIVKTFDMGQPGTLNASSSGGGITVTTHDLKKVEIQAFVRKNGRILSPSDPILTEVLEDFDLVMEKNGSVITVDAKRKSFMKSWNNTGISFTIKVPQEMSCNVSSSGGGVEINNVKGTHDFSSSGGGVRLGNITGTTKVRSSGGGVNVKNHTGEIHLSSSGGGVYLTESHGSVFASSSGGRVELKDIHGDVEAGSSGGGVSISGTSDYVKASSSGGSVHVNISNLSKELNLTSSGGGIDAVIKNGDRLGLDLDLSSDKVNIDLKNFSGRAEKNRVKGTMNKGGIPVYMHSSGGNINVHFED